MGEGNNIFCIGEILWDALPGGLFLGGAPLNVCIQLHNLGEPSRIISRVGRDRLGEEALRRIDNRGIPLEFIQSDENLETGFVEVQLDTRGEPEYTILKPVAWDRIELYGGMEESVSGEWGIVFGSLAQRQPVSRETIHQLLELDLTKIFDINLRHPFENKLIVEASLEVADLVKMNQDELKVMTEWFQLSSDIRDAVYQFADRFDLSLVCITRGRHGAFLYHRERWSEHPGFDVPIADTVGSGDAFLAGLIHAYRKGLEDIEILEYANACGGYVAMKSGATPELNTQAIEKIIRDHRKD